jgi:hypothetical protein
MIKIVFIVNGRGRKNPIKKGDWFLCKMMGCAAEHGYL